MEISSTTPTVSWKQVAVQKQENLRTGASGVPIRETVVAVQTQLYEAKNGSVEVKSLNEVRRVNILV